MRSILRGRLLAVALLSPLVTVAACGGSSSGGSSPSTEPGSSAASAAAGTTCPSNLTLKAAQQLPSNVPLPEGSTAAYQYFPQGATHVWFFALDGSPSDLVSVRDTYDKALVAKGYKIHGTDQEENSEAESEFGGPHHGTTNVRPLCDGKIVFRLKLTN